MTMTVVVVVGMATAMVRTVIAARSSP